MSIIIDFTKKKGIGATTKDYFGYSKSDGKIRAFYSRQFKKWVAISMDKYGTEVVDYFDSKSQIEKWFDVKLKK